MSIAQDWTTFQSHLLRYTEPAISIDYSRMGVPENFLTTMRPLTERAILDMQALESGEIANPDEKRMVGHYWLRNAELAPADLQATIHEDITDVIAFAKETHAAGRFTHVLIIGIGGSALGPQLVAEALGGDAKMSISFFDNTDPAGVDNNVAAIADKLPSTLAIVISKSGGTPETRNGMLEAEAAFERHGLDFAKQAIAVTGIDSKLDNYARDKGWIKRFRMHDWIGGRTSIMSTVGLLPAALQGVDIEQFLAGAAVTDELTRNPDASQNASMLLAMMWHHAGNGKGEKDMVVLPYKDSLVLFSKYLQQLVMESLGKEHDLDGKTVHQGIAVYGNKGSTDQHAYVQQLRDGVHNFFATFIEVREGRKGASIEVEDGIRSGDYLQGFLRGTRTALADQGRASITISIPSVDAYHLGTLIALFERAVSFYASFVNINAYHQPGVEAGKKAAGAFLETLTKTRLHLTGNIGQSFTAEEVATATGNDPEETFHILTHLAANSDEITTALGNSAADDHFTHS
ncbi:MAG: glucose-6-phosphate isomerase [Verrucomicrobiales bacterium]|jgi:glucose-6-phosphate isomerase